LKLRYADSRGIFIFFATGRPYHEVAAALAAKGFVIGRPFPSLDRWVRISIGLPAENSAARQPLPNCSLDAKFLQGH
jgi:histidinol-phosphate aminotransferase